MNKLALDFWEGKGIGISKLVAMGEGKGIPDYKIKNAAEIVYQEITDGKRQDNSKIAYAVVKLAKDLDSKKYEDDQRLISDTSAVLEGIKAEIEAANKAKAEEHDENIRLGSQIQELNYENEAWQELNGELKGDITVLIAQQHRDNIYIAIIFIATMLSLIFFGAIF